MRVGRCWMLLSRFLTMAASCKYDTPRSMYRPWNNRPVKVGPGQGPQLVLGPPMRRWALIQLGAEPG